MRIDQLMTKDVLSISAAEAADSAWEKMRLHRIHHLVVMNGHRVAGVVSERDLGGARGTQLRKGRDVGDLMTVDPVCATPMTTIRQAANLMRGRSIGCLPVVEGKRLVGIVTVTDVLELIGKGDSYEGRRPPRWKPEKRMTSGRRAASPKR